MYPVELLGTPKVQRSSSGRLHEPQCPLSADRAVVSNAVHFAAICGLHFAVELVEQACMVVSHGHLQMRAHRRGTGRSGGLLFEDLRAMGCGLNYRLVLLGPLAGVVLSYAIEAI